MTTDRFSWKFAGLVYAAFFALFMIPLAEAQTQETPGAAPNEEDVHALPLFEVPEKMESTDMLGIFISGDGGWWTLDKTVSQVLAKHGVPVVGISSYRYFSKSKTPERTAVDMARVARHYLAQWKKRRVVLMGYSLGAEIIPFVANRMPEDLAKQVAAVVMIGPSAETAFEFHVTDWIASGYSGKTYPVQPEIDRLPGVKLLCAYAEKDAECICGKQDAAKVTSIRRDGDHHFGGDYTGLGEAIWQALPKAPETQGK